MSSKPKQRSIFSHGDPWQLNACVNYGDGWFAYANGYKEAADIVAQRLMSGKGTLDLVVYPLVFLYRQYFELQLKQIIRDCSCLLARRHRVAGTHSLADLWKQARELLLETEAEFSDHSSAFELSAVDRVIVEFTKVDPRSMAFRYPIDLEGQPFNRDMRYINVARLKKVVDKAHAVLDGVDTTLSVWHDWQQEYLSSLY